MRRLLPLAAALLAAAPATAAAQTDPTQGVRVCIVDTGINATHKEFAPGQLVGFWNFTDATARGALQAFDPKHPPADGNGHGTLTASMAVGLNADPAKTRSFAPGFRFAAAKVVTDSGSVSGDIAAAIRWCTDVIGAQVINISIGTIVPVSYASQVAWADDYSALSYARSKGVLVTVANGNGTGNLGLVPGDGASSNYGMSADVLSVGASGTGGATVSYQPEVAAQYSITGPVHNNSEGYRNAGGTSFSSPLVGGFAARLVAEARSAGRDLKADALETLVKSAARDTEMPPFWEGYGVVDAAQLAGALAAAREGRLVARPSPDPSATYVEQVAGTQRSLHRGELPGG